MSWSGLSVARVISFFEILNVGSVAPETIGARRQVEGERRLLGRTIEQECFPANHNDYRPCRSLVEFFAEKLAMNVDERNEFDLDALGRGLLIEDEEAAGLMLSVQGQQSSTWTIKG
jgi:hypothetical protein